MGSSSTGFHDRPCSVFGDEMKMDAETCNVYMKFRDLYACLSQVPPHVILIFPTIVNARNTPDPLLTQRLLMIPDQMNHARPVGTPQQRPEPIIRTLGIVGLQGHHLILLCPPGFPPISPLTHRCRHCIGISGSMSLCRRTRRRPEATTTTAYRTNCRDCGPRLPLHRRLGRSKTQ